MMMARRPWAVLELTDKPVGFILDLMVDSTSKSLIVVDVSNGKERLPVSCVNEIDSIPLPSFTCNAVIAASPAYTKPDLLASDILEARASLYLPCECEGGNCNGGCPCLRSSSSQKHSDLYAPFPSFFHPTPSTVKIFSYLCSDQKFSLMKKHGYPCL